MLTCTRCKVEKSLDKYYTKKNDGKRYIRECKDCFQARIAQNRRDLKLQLVKEAGGVCQRCGYSRSMRALTFHHKEPNQKEFAISQGKRSNMDKLRAEAAKCQLLCHNCHSEKHDGLW